MFLTTAKFFGLIFIFAGGVLANAAENNSSLAYNRDVRPILSENCFSCHGPDSAARKAGLRLDNFAGATNQLESGVAAVVPGAPEQSELVRRIFLTDDEQMPPEKIHKTLKPAEKELLKQWVAAGAKYEAHWSFLPPVKAALPPVKNSKWVRSPVDRFILARLDAEKLKPNAEADKRTLIRRVSLDLTGLPPSPAAVETFLADKSPAAYEKLVDRLLASPQWGEHRGRYWLDAARYGDTHGIHFDNFREMWSYRDWVINAFNANMAFDVFTMENLAGDLLPNATRDQKIASGFNRCNITSNEGGSIDEEVNVSYTRDRTETTSAVWLGLTTGCAVCHDHKYDPISQQDFYSLSAFFNNTTQKAMDGNIKDTPPVMVIPKPEDDARWAMLPDVQRTNEGKIDDRKKVARPDFERWLANPDFTSLDTHLPQKDLLFRAALDEGETNRLTVAVKAAERVIPLATNAATRDGIVSAQALIIGANAAPRFEDVGDFERTNAFSYAVWVWRATDENGSLFARMSDRDKQYTGWDFYLEGGKPTFHLVHDWPESALKVGVKDPLSKERWHHIAVTYDGKSRAKGVKIYVDGMAQELAVGKDTLKKSVRTQSPFTLGSRDGGAGVPNTGLQDLRLYGRGLTPAEVRAVANIPRLKFVAGKPAAQRDTNELETVYPTWLGSVDAAYGALMEAKAAFVREENEIKMRGTVAHVMQEKPEAPEAYVLFRGQYDQRRDRVTPATPASLPPMATNAPRNRLGFAEWLLRPENPLTARVTVNRFWQELFGNGLVKTAGDFGVAGEQPSHPELLDWLAVDFREHGWDVKRIFKLMVLSATYRQSAVTSPEKISRDPQNLWLARGPRFRMDGEMIRDYALAASGLLVEKIGGPSVKPYQPPGIWDVVGMAEGNTRIYLQDHGDDLYRRSVYSFWKRQAAPASLEIFNAPSREVCTVKRERTDTPLQALVTLNDPQFVEAARHLADHALARSKGREDEAIDEMAQRLLSRGLTAKEKSIVKRTLVDMHAFYEKQPEAAKEFLAVGEFKPSDKVPVTQLAAMTMVANQLMNLDEVLNK